jgi:hypothetical protein
MGDSTDGMDIAKHIRWTPMLEDYFASTGEKAHCLSWVHKRAEELYSKRRTYIDLPVIILSSVTGFLSVGTNSLFNGHQELASVFLGGMSLLVSVLNTTGSYFGWAKRTEGHRISSIHYAKLYRFLSVEMSLPREERMSPHDLLKYVKDQYDRLAEVSPLLPQPVIKLFQEKFADETEISKPEEANGLEKIVVFRGDDMTIPPPALRQRSGTPSNQNLFFNPMLKAIRSVSNGIRKQTSLKTVLETQPEPIPAAALVQTPVEVEVPSAPIPSS